ncbi:MAG: FAD-dependent oxidoreductase [Actinomycetota bacterium]|nr:FAD-dependent oxidoreductase [Actinomycetota bacterium]
MADAAVEVRLGASVVELGVDRVAFAGGEVLDVDIVVVATGPIAAPFAALVPGRRDSMGWVLVDRFRRAPAAPTVFVTGDAAAADTGDGHLALASCQHALQLGRVAGENAARDLRGLELVAYEQLRYVTCLDLGRSSAVLTQGWDREVVLAGPEAKRRKVMINTQVIYPPDGAALDELLRQSALDPADRG